MAVQQRARAAQRRAAIAGTRSCAGAQRAADADAAQLHASASKRSTRRSIRRRAICARTSRPRSCEKGKTLLAERVKPEMHQSVVEIGTGVCRNIQEARDEIRDIRARR